VTAPRILRRYDGSTVLTFPFDAWLVAALKVHVPAHARQYDPVAKSWTVAPTYAGVATRLMYQAFTDVEMIDAHAGPTFDRGTGTRDDPYVVLHLRPTAPPELVTAAYKCLARLHHPDRGGDHDAMLAINAAAEQIRSAQ
jgi:hypothetical protein